MTRQNNIFKWMIMMNLLCISISNLYLFTFKCYLRMLCDRIPRGWLPHCSSLLWPLLISVWITWPVSDHHAHISFSWYHLSALPLPWDCQLFENRDCVFPFLSNVSMESIFELLIQTRAQFGFNDEDKEKRKNSYQLYLQDVLMLKDLK